MLPELIDATYLGDLATVNKLLAAGADVNQVTKNGGSTALLLAIKKGHTDIARRLLAVRGINVNHQDYDSGDTALILAAELGRVGVVRALLSVKDINVNKANGAGDTALLWAVRRGHTDFVGLLLALGAEVNHANISHDTALTCALEKVPTDIARRLLAAEGLDVNTANGDGDTLLTVAARKGHIEVVRLLLAAKGIDVNYISNKPDTVLTEAARVCHRTEIVGDTALSLAARSGHTEVVRLLLGAEAIDVNYTNAKHDTALRVAAWAGHTETVAALLAAGADVNCADKNNRTVLIAAASVGHAEIVAALLAAGANVNHQDNDGETALILAEKGGHIEVVMALLAADAQTDRLREFNPKTMVWSGTSLEFKGISIMGLDVGRCDKDTIVRLRDLALYGDCMMAQGEPELDWRECNRALLQACKADPVFDGFFKSKQQNDVDPAWALVNLMEWLCERDSAGIKKRPGARDKWLAFSGRTWGGAVTVAQQFINAARSGDLTNVNKLWASGADVNHADKHGMTALQCAAMEGHAEVVVFLLADTRINVNQPDRRGNTALIWAANQGHAEVVGDLLTMPDINVSHFDKRFNTALMLAAMEGHAGIVSALLDSDCSENHVNFFDRHGSTALMMAAEYGRADAVNVLLARGADVGRSRALQAAVGKGYTEVVSVLLAGGADTTRVPVLRVAEEKGHAAVVSLLKQADFKRVFGVEALLLALRACNDRLSSFSFPERKAAMWSLFGGQFILYRLDKDPKLSDEDKLREYLAYAQAHSSSREALVLHKVCEEVDLGACQRLSIEVLGGDRADVVLPVVAAAAPADAPAPDVEGQSVFAVDGLWLEGVNVQPKGKVPSMLLRVPDLPDRSWVYDLRALILTSKMRAIGVTSKVEVYMQAMPGGSHDNPAYAVVFVGQTERLDAAQIADGGAAAAPPAP